MGLTGVYQPDAERMVPRPNVASRLGCTLDRVSSRRRVGNLGQPRIDLSPAGYSVDGA
jgi:hypothetical protein